MQIACKPWFYALLCFVTAPLPYHRTVCVAAPRLTTFSFVFSACRLYRHAGDCLSKLRQSCFFAHKIYFIKLLLKVNNCVIIFLNIGFVYAYNIINVFNGHRKWLTTYLLWSAVFCFWRELSDVVEVKWNINQYSNVHL